MATKKTTNETTTESATESPKLQVTESIYNVDELAQYANSVFGVNVRSECVVAAFKDAGKDSVTIAEAKKIVGNFLKKEVN